MYCTKFPKEIQELMDIVNPYIDRCQLRENAPQEIKEAYQKVCIMLDRFLKEGF